MVTCDDYTNARIIAASSVDCILVGDSVAMAMHGHDSTLAADASLIALHIQAVRRGAPQKFIIGDMPVVAHRGSLDKSLDSVSQIMRAGAQAVNIEGMDGSESSRLEYALAAAALARCS